MKPQEFTNALNVFGDDERMSKLTSDYKTLEETYMRVLRRMEKAQA